MHRKLLKFVVLSLCSINCQHYNDNNYLVSTKSCKIPDLPINIPGDDPLLNNFPPVECSRNEILHSYVEKEEEKYILKVDRVAQSDKDWSQEYQCCYSYVNRNGSVEFPDEGVSVTPCKPFKSVELTSETVWVGCIQKQQTFLNTTKPVHQNVHQVIKINESLKEKSKKLVENLTDQRPISVLFIVFDGVSRMNFIRTMPETNKFVKENGFYELRGYNKIDDNTYPNFMAWLTGFGKQGIFNICKPNETEGLMNCPMIWYQYQSLGYITAYGEDWAPLATFNYFKKGFKHPPTDFYFKPFFDALSQLNVTLVDTMPYCTGPESQGEKILNLAIDFSKATKNLPSFGVFWANTFSHNNRNTTKRMDAKAKEVFKTLKNDGVLDEKIVILLSDHGNRYGDLIGTGRGFFEERLPMHYISLPTWFKTKFPQEAKNLQTNTEKLTSTYDLYMTLQHLLVLSGLNVTVNQSHACPNCKSLFEELPDDRSCKDAGIPEEWCSCIGAIHNEKISFEEEKSIRLFIETEVLKVIRKKEVIQFLKITQVAKSEPSSDKIATHFYYLVRFSTTAKSNFQVVFKRLTNSWSNLKIIHIRKVY